MEPNYKTNENRHVKKLLQQLRDKKQVEIDLIDIWGEGFLSHKRMITGFKRSYNINKYDQLVSNPPDKDREIPNLIPVKSWSSDFGIIPDKSVKTITLMGAPITHRTAEEIRRIIQLKGNVIIYGFDENDPERKILANALKKIGFFETKNYNLDEEFSMITLQPIVVYTSKNKPSHVIHEEL